MHRKCIALAIFLAIALIQTSCTTVHTENISDNSVLGNNQGILVARIRSNVPATLHYLEYAPATTFGANLAQYYSGPIGSIQVKAGDDYYVTTLDQGEYMWGYLVHGNRRGDYRTTNKFVIQKNKLNYVGDIEIDVSALKMQIAYRDETDSLVKYMQSSYPSLSRRFPLTKDFTQFKP